MTINKKSYGKNTDHQLCCQSTLVQILKSMEHEDTTREEKKRRAREQAMKERRRDTESGEPGSHDVGLVERRKTKKLKFSLVTEDWGNRKY